MLLLKDVGLVLVFSCAISVTAWETVETVHRLVKTVEHMIGAVRAPLPGEDQDAKDSVVVPEERRGEADEA